MRVFERIKRTVFGVFTMFIGWAIMAVAASFAPFTHTLPLETRWLVALPLAVVAGISAALVISYGLAIIIGLRQIPYNITFTYGGN